MRVLIALLALSTASAAAGQAIRALTGPSPRAPEGEFENNADGATRLLFGYSRCFAYERPSVAEKILDLPLHSPEQEAAIRKNIAGASHCLNRVGGGLRVKAPSVFLAGMAEERFLHRYGKHDLAAIIAASSAVEPRNDWEAFSLCVVRRNPDQSRAVLGTSSRSAEEAAAVKALIPDLGPCVPQGVQLKLDRYAIRSYVAMGLYRSGRGSEK